MRLASLDALQTPPYFLRRKHPLVAGDDDDEAEYERNRAKKAQFKSTFDSEYDKDKKALRDEAGAGSDEEDEYLSALKREKEARETRNAAEFSNLSPERRAAHEGYRAGSYVKIVLKGVPTAFTRNFKPENPAILGGLLQGETQMGMIRARVKKHRWHSKILKCQDPLIFSIGWRRYQSLPLLSTEDQNERHRYLKYTPEHMHCYATFWGPLVAPNTGFCCIKSVSDRLKGFRIAATGNTLAADASFSVVKKLKLVGSPKKIFKNTAFVSGLFNSDLEASRFLGAGVKTVSGIRGQVKKAEGGDVRCTFEDKLLMSDIVFVRTWMPVEAKKYCNPMTDLTTEGGVEWRGMKSKAELMLEKGKPIEVNPDSIYKPITREERRFNPLKVPKR